MSTLQFSAPSIPSTVCSNGMFTFLVFIPTAELSVNTKFNSNSPSYTILPFRTFTLVISGMGTSTILHILRDDKKLKNIKKNCMRKD